MALRPRRTCASIHSRCGSHAERASFGITRGDIPAEIAGGRGGGIWIAVDRRREHRTHVVANRFAVDARGSMDLALSDTLANQRKYSVSQMRLQDIHLIPPRTLRGRIMSCRQRTEYRCFTSSLTRQVGESEVATGGGIWVATGDKSSITEQAPVRPVLY